MPEYLAPGVYVEETSFRSKSIEGVGTSTTAFVGPTLKGPYKLTPELLTSFGDFERIYGGLENINNKTNYIAHAVRAYFDNGGARLYVSRVVPASAAIAESVDLVSTAETVKFVARFPGEAGNGEITLLQKANPVSLATLSSAPIGSILQVETPALPAKISGNQDAAFVLPDGGKLFLKVNNSEKEIPFPKKPQSESVTLKEINDLLQPLAVQATLVNNKLVLTTNLIGKDAKLEILNKENSVHTIFGLPITSAQGADKVSKYYLKKDVKDWRNAKEALTENLLTQTPQPQTSILTLTVIARDKEGNEVSYEDLGFDSRHPRWVGDVLSPTPSKRADTLTNPFALTVTKGVDGLALQEAIFTSQPPSRTITLSQGSSGSDPSVDDYRQALDQLSSLEDISIVAAPGHSAYEETLFLGIQQELIKYVSRRRAYQIAVLDTPPNQDINGARTVRGRIDSSYAALYYPWVVVANPLARPGSANVPAEIALPPSGFISGIYARSDVERGVYKAPANEVVRGAIRFESDINFAQQEVLNPLGINCLRFFPGRGYRVWGARTTSSDPEWKYVNIRRYFNYLESSIDRSTQWAVFEPNGERLWANIRDTIGDFLYNEWVSGALLGSSPQTAYFVRCDRSTMTQNDIDNGRLIALIGVAAIKPAEFVVFRIGQKTADTRS